jgi:tripartite-type tricarboxylate transporter receptor subunit TctC
MADGEWRMAEGLIESGETNPAGGEMKKRLNVCAALLALMLTGGAAVAAESASTGSGQAWPARPVRLIVPFPPGGSNDIVGRVIGQHLGERLGKPLVIDNRGGAGGTIGTEIAIRSQPDGYTLLIISVAYSYNPSIYKLPYDPMKAIAPVAMIGSGPNVLVVNPSVPAKSVKELLALAKAKPGQLNYASAGIGSFQHLSSELFRIMSGVNIVHIPYKGGGPAMLAVMSGQAQVSIGSLIQTMPHIRSGKFRALATGGAKRNPALPDVPTVAEAGVPGYEAANWWGIVAPAGVSPAIVKRVNTEVAAILAMPETKKWFVNEGAEAVSKTPDEFRKWIASEMGKWGKVVKEAGIKPE